MPPVAPFAAEAKLPVAVVVAVPPLIAAVMVVLANNTVELLKTVPEFLGANIYAVSTAKRFGIDSSRAVRYNSDSIGTKKNFEVLNEAVEEVRSGRELTKSWKQEIEEDYENRGK